MNNTTPLDHITVNLSTGALSYERPEGFVLDMERMYRGAARFVGFCGGDMTMAVKHAVHEQLSAHRGLASLRRVTR
jgi:hypothetical protein